ncbi:MAG: phosphate ABC transporter permease subunit PstC [Flavobacteriaceae bacterium]|jgi:phosphate transport system permease protein|nr:phosphate ABC transporter permease subunit PstC [Flavobacteriaceae bacterium]
MKDKLFKFLLFLASFLILLLTAGIIYALISQSMKTFSETGFFQFIISDKWNPKTEEYGALSFISGTLMTSVLALVFCILFSLPVALFNGEYFRKKKISFFVGSMVDLLAGIPSIVYGLWGFYVVCPVLVSLGVSNSGFGVLLASVVLAIMIIPYASSLSAEFISMVPNELKEAAYSLGATRLEVISRISLPVAGSGILTAYILALGRALGETMAVTMLIGNTNAIPSSILDTGNTMASIIANQFGEADGIKLSSLTAIGLLLFLITAIINIIAKYSMRIINQ